MMFAFVSIVAIVSGLYYYHEDKMEEKMGKKA